MRDRRLNKMKRDLDSAFARVDLIDPLNEELRNDLSRYLCIRVSAFLETSVKRLFTSYSQAKSFGYVGRYAEHQLGTLNTVNYERLRQLSGSFDDEWRVRLVESMPPDQKDAIDSIMANRHLIAHGETAPGMSYPDVRDYYIRIVTLLTTLEDELVPRP